MRWKNNKDKTGTASVIDQSIEVGEKMNAF